MSLQDRIYVPEASEYDTSLDDYYDRVSEFGEFIENGRGYRITKKKTPRPWLSFNCNDDIISLVANDGKGTLAYGQCNNKLTRYDTRGLRVMSYPNGKRGIEITFENETFDFFELENLICTVRPGYTEFEASRNGIKGIATVFVPNEEPCEIWKLQLINESVDVKKLDICFWQDWVGEKVEDNQFLTSRCQDSSVSGLLTTTRSYDELYVFFGSPQTEATTVTFDSDNAGESYRYTRPILKRSVELREDVTLFVVSGGSVDASKAEKFLSIYPGLYEVNMALEQVKAKWNRAIERNYCELPDKNVQNFLNVWLKNQLYMTYRCNRADMMGYRDVLQDSWGYTLVEPENASRKLLEALSNMYADGRCPRQYDVNKKEYVDDRDFADSPIWIPAAISSYIYETGNADILDTLVGFFDNDEMKTVEEHIDIAFDYLYHSRGKNGLVLVRDGDWLDGLAHLNKYGADATSVWQTVATYHGQSILADLYEALNKNDKVALLRQRNEEYKEIVNRVGWDGNWYTYAFFEDGEPIGSHTNLEGKIYLNVQTWAIFSGICDDKDKQRRIYKAMMHHLSTPYGWLLLDPPYVNHGERCGRLQRQRPGTFANGAIYNHGSSFKVFADVALGQYDDALDTLQRCLPNHPDNPTTRRTSEPYVVGNVYYGPHHPRYGMNLQSWITATPAWLIHGGFEQILGVRVGWEGLTFTPHVPDEWKEYSVIKQWRGTRYEIQFIRSSEKGVFADGEKVEGPLKSTNKECKVRVQF